MDPRERLHRLVEERELSPSAIATHREEGQRRVLEVSEHLDGPDFTRIHPADLEEVFDGIDQRFFEGLLGQQAERDRLGFRLSARMTSVGGKTTAWRIRGSDERHYEIAISTTLLFEAFDEPHREMTVVGLPCPDRITALQRIMEHEVVHLVEMWLWEGSSCRKPRFQGIARRLFGHTDHRHRLVTPRERATAQLGIEVGRTVAFEFEGRRRVGIVNRITRRATVLVADRRGQRYSDGKRYLKFYVPLDALEPV